MKQYEYLGKLVEIPEGYAWVATEKDGFVYAFKQKPFLKEARVWSSGSSSWYRLKSKVPPREDWWLTLRRVSDLSYVKEQPETSQQDKPMITLPAGTAVTVDGVTYYLTEQVATTTEKPKTAEELAREWWGRIAPEGSNRFGIDRYGDVDRESYNSASDFANTWPSQEIAERRSKQITAQNLLILAAMECNRKYPCDNNDKGWYLWRYSGVFGIQHTSPIDQWMGPRFNRREELSEAMDHLHALGLLEYLILDMTETT